MYIYIYTYELSMIPVPGSRDSPPPIPRLLLILHQGTIIVGVNFAKNLSNLRNRYVLVDPCEDVLQLGR